MKKTHAIFLAFLAVCGFCSFALTGGFIAYPYAAFVTIPPEEPSPGTYQIPDVQPIRSLDVEQEWIFVPAKGRLVRYVKVTVIGQYSGSPQYFYADSQKFTFIAQQK